MNFGCHGIEERCFLYKGRPMRFSMFGMWFGCLSEEKMSCLLFSWNVLNK